MRAYRACLSCHSGRQSQQFPVLAGQHAEYIEEQIRLWRRGGRSDPLWEDHDGGCRRTGRSADQDVAAYLGSLPRERHGPMTEANR
ncbi:c-type cytochrome (plasmid) [Sinorhizobium meliloti]|nr:c-type cytochrome [Sinorhizobium meliloti]